MARIPVDKEGRVGDPRNNRNAIVDRRQFLSQLYDANGNPTRVMYEFCGRMDKEAGDLGPEGRMAWAETVFNRAAARGHTIDYELRNHGNYNYWPKFQPQPGYLKKQEYVDIIANVCKNGTNLTLGATGNASLGVGVGRLTHKVKYESFGVETPDNKWWNTKFAKAIIGVGKFIGDIVGAGLTAIGQGIAAVAKGAVEVGKWIIGGIASAFSPNSAHAQPHSDQSARDHARRAQVDQSRDAPPPKTELRWRITPEPVVSPPIKKWVINAPIVPEPSHAAEPASRPERQPRP